MVYRGTFSEILKGPGAELISCVFVSFAWLLHPVEVRGVAEYGSNLEGFVGDLGLVGHGHLGPTIGSGGPAANRSLRPRVSWAGSVKLLLDHHLPDVWR